MPPLNTRWVTFIPGQYSWECSFCRVISQMPQRRWRDNWCEDRKKSGVYDSLETTRVLLSTVVVTLLFKPLAEEVEGLLTSTPPPANHRSLGGYKLIGVRTASAMQAAAARSVFAPALSWISCRVMLRGGRPPLHSTEHVLAHGCLVLLDGPSCQKQSKPSREYESIWKQPPRP